MERTFWLCSDEPTGQEFEKPLEFSFPQLPTNTKEFVLQTLYWCSISNAAEGLRDNYKAGVAAGQMSTGCSRPGRLQGVRGRSTRTHARGAPRASWPPVVGPGSYGKEGGQRSRQTSRGRQHRLGRPPDPNTSDSLEESTDRHPLGHSSAAPLSPRDPGALPKLTAPLCP